MKNLTKIQKLFQENLNKSIDKDIFFNYPLKNLTTFKIGGDAEVFLRTSQEDLLIEVLKFAYQNQIKIKYLGGGSNILISDQNISGLIVKYTNQNYSINKSILTASTSLNTSFLANFAIKNNLAGLENFTSLPGTIGGAIYNNSHYKTKYFGDLIKEIRFFDGQEIINMTKKDCDFQYDHSIFLKKSGFILSASFQLEKIDDNQILLERSKKTLQLRQITQPLNFPSAGCVFKNPKNTGKLQKLFPQFKEKEFISAGFLIDKANLKGTQIGDAIISEKHASFILNLGQATSQDVLNLIKKVQIEIKNCFEIDLETEIFYFN
jgi:UDP-N-acetylmuramate dehydrogenase